MTIQGVRLGAAWAVLAAALWLPGGAGGDPLEDVIEVESSGNKASAASQEQIDTTADETDQLLAEYRATLEQIESLRIYNRQLDNLVAAQEAEIGSIREQIENVLVIGRGVTPLMLSMVEGLESFVALDVPFLVEERETRVASIVDMMGRADVTDAEKYRRIMEAYQIENDYGRKISAYQGELARNGRALTVDFLQIGRVALIYKTLDEKEMGAWDARRREWVELGSEYRNPIRKGFRMARKQAAPDLIRLPILAPEGAL